jgi:hypothetical protein
MENKTWLVYVHTSPNGKRYVGITSHSSVSKRWGMNGIGYKGNRQFYEDICKYGWDNFTHETINKNLTKDEAFTKEKQYILDNDLMNPEFGYNKSITRHPINCSDEFRKKQGVLIKEQWKRPEYRADVSAKHSESMKQKYKEGWKPIWIHKDGTEITVDDSQLEEFLIQDWIKGRLPMVYINDGKGVQKRVTEAEREQLLKEGWFKGRGKMDSISKAKAGVPVPGRREDKSI